MTEQKTKQAGTRKAYAARGEKAQRMMSFRLDYENAQYLSTKANKGRFINELLARERAKEQEQTGGK